MTIPEQQRPSCRSLTPLLLFVVTVALLLPGCATTSSRRYKTDLRKVLDQGISLLGQTKVRVGRKPFRNDCSGFVTACFSTVGAELIEPLVTGPSSSGMMFKTLKKQRRVHNRKRPLPGDLAFFHNTHDRNGNGLRDDQFTHVALVERVDDDGTIILLHFLSGEIRRDRVNRFHRNKARDPDSGKVWNSYLRKGGGKVLTSQLLFRFARPLPPVNRSVR
jgi:cell wall-associated NlpC family hydrolase